MSKLDLGSVVLFFIFKEGLEVPCLYTLSWFIHFYDL